MTRRNSKERPARRTRSSMLWVAEALEPRAMLAGVGPESWSAPGLASAPLATGLPFSSGMLLTCSSLTPGSSRTSLLPAPTLGTGGTQSTGLALPSNSGSGTGSSPTGSGSSNSGGLALPSNSGSGAGAGPTGSESSNSGGMALPSNSGSGAGASPAGSGSSNSGGLALPSNSGSGAGSSPTGSGSSNAGGLALPSNSGSGAGSSNSRAGSNSDLNSPVLSSQYTGGSNTGGQGTATNTCSGGDLWFLYGAGSGNGYPSSGAKDGSTATSQSPGTGATLTIDELWRLYWSGAGAGSSSGSDNGSVANDLTISAKYTGGSGGGLMFFATGATEADAANSGSQEGTTGSTALTLANGQSTVTTTPLVYQPGSDDGPGVVTAVWTGCEGDVQFMPVADEDVRAASPPEYSGPTIQAAPPWYISAWYTFFGRLASDQPLISDPRGSKSFEAGGTTYFVPNYVHDDTFYWIAGNLYHRPLIGDVIGTAELPFRFLANPGRFANATVDGAVGTITNIPRLPEIWSDMPDYQRQDWVIRMLAIPYLGAIRPELAGAGKTSRTPGPIAGSADDTAGAATSVVDDAAKGLPPRGVRPTDTPIPEGHTRVFRAVGEDEYQDIISKRQLREGPNSLEGKLFADSLDGAIDHGCALFPNGKFRLIEVDIPNDTPSLFRQPNLDGRGPARFVHNDDLPALSPRPLE